jgi:hypothetical protein
MRVKLLALGLGVGVGFVMAWARVSDPAVIRDMLLLRELDVFFLMGSAVLVAALGSRLLRAARARALVTGELVSWTVEKPARRHILGSLLFGVGWSVAATCPGPVAAMMGEGRAVGFVVALGLLGGVALQGSFARRGTASAGPPDDAQTAGL